MNYTFYSRLTFKLKLEQKTFSSKLLDRKIIEIFWFQFLRVKKAIEFFLPNKNLFK